MFPAVSRQSFCIGVFLEISYYLGAAILEGIFQWLFLTFFYHYICFNNHFFLFSLCVHVLVCYNTTCEHYYKCQLFCWCLLLLLLLLFCVITSGQSRLIWLLLLLINLPYIILLLFTLKIFSSQHFNLFFQTNCKNCKKYFM